MFINVVFLKESSSQILNRKITYSTDKTNEL